MKMDREVGRRLQILFVSSDKYPPFRPAARAIFMEELGKRGHLVDWIIQAERDCPKAYVRETPGGRFFIGATDDGESRVARFRKHMLGLVNDLKLIREIRKGRYDVVQVKDKYLATLLAIVTAKLSRVPLAYWLAYPHAESSLHVARNGIARYRVFYEIRGYLQKFLLYKLILPNAAHTFVQSEQMKRDIACEGISSEKMTAVPSSVNLERSMFRPVPAGRKPEQGGELRVVYVGTLLRERRLDFVVQSFANVVSVFPEAKLYFIGMGENPADEELLRDVAEELDITESIVFTGQLSMESALDIARTARVCLSPYYPTTILNSTSPTKLVEYMALSRPVVCNEHPEQSEIIAKSRAGLCVPWKVEDFSAAIIKLLRDPVEGDEMGHRGRSFVEAERTNGRMADIVIEQYARLLESPSDADVNHVSHHSRS